MKGGMRTLNEHTLVSSHFQDPPIPKDAAAAAAAPVADDDDTGRSGRVGDGHDWTQDTPIGPG